MNNSMNGGMNGGNGNHNNGFPNDDGLSRQSQNNPNGQRQINMNPNQIQVLVQRLKSEVSLAKAAGDDKAKAQQHFAKAESIRQHLLAYQAQQKARQAAQGQQVNQNLNQNQLQNSSQGQNIQNTNQGQNQNQGMQNSQITQAQRMAFNQSPNVQSPMMNNRPSSNATPVSQSPQMQQTRLQRQSPMQSRQSPLQQARQSPLMQQNSQNAQLARQQQQQQQQRQSPNINTAAQPTHPTSTAAGLNHMQIPPGAITVERFNVVKQRLQEVGGKLRFLEQSKQGTITAEQLAQIDAEISDLKGKFAQYQKVGLLMKNQLVQLQQQQQQQQQQLGKESTAVNGRAGQVQVGMAQQFNGQSQLQNPVLNPQGQFALTQIMQQQLNQQQLNHNENQPNNQLMPGQLNLNQLNQSSLDQNLLNQNSLQHSLNQNHLNQNLLNQNLNNQIPNQGALPMQSALSSPTILGRQPSSQQTLQQQLRAQQDAVSVNQIQQVQQQAHQILQQQQPNRITQSNVQPQNHLIGIQNGQNNQNGLLNQMNKLKQVQLQRNEPSLQGSAAGTPQMQVKAQSPMSSNGVSVPGSVGSGIIPANVGLGGGVGDASVPVNAPGNALTALNGATEASPPEDDNSATAPKSDKKGPSIRTTESAPINLAGITKPSVPSIPISTSIDIKPPTMVTLKPKGDYRFSLTGGTALSLGAILNTPAITRLPMFDLSTSLGQSSLPETRGRVLTKRKLTELVSNTGVDDGDGKTSIDGNVEELLLDLADEFIHSVTSFACRLAKHRRVDAIEPKDVQLHLERNWNIKIPGYAMDEVRNLRKMQPSNSYAQKVSGVEISKSVNGNID